MNNKLGSIVIIFCLMTACTSNNAKDSDVNQVTGIPLEIIGMSIDTNKACIGFNGDTLYPINSMTESGLDHHLVLYFSEFMCIECIGDAIDFLKNSLDEVGACNKWIIVGYENVRNPALILKQKGLMIPFCNIRHESLFEQEVFLDKPFFLVIDNSGKVIEYFDMNTSDIERNQIQEIYFSPIPYS